MPMNTAQTASREAIASAVRMELARKNITVSEAAAHLGIARTAMSRRVNGWTSFSADQIVALATLLNRPAADLLAVAA